MHAHTAHAILLPARGISPTKLYALTINLPPGEVRPACGAERFRCAPFPAPLALDPSNEWPPQSGQWLAVIQRVNVPAVDYVAIPVLGRTCAFIEQILLQ